MYGDLLSLTWKIKFSVTQIAFKNGIMLDFSQRVVEAPDLCRYKSIGDKIGLLFVVHKAVLE